MTSLPFLSCHRHVRQTGGMCQFALAVLAWHPHNELRIDNALRPREFEAHLWSGLKEGLSSALEGRKVRVVLIDAQVHEVDSSPTSFRIAGLKAVKEVQSRLQALAGADEERAPEEIRALWQGRQARALGPVRTTLSQHLDWNEPTDCWLRRREPIGQVVRLRGDAPHIWTTVDLELGLFSPALNDLFGIGPWSENPARSPWEFGKIRLSKLCQTQAWELKDGVEGILEQRWLDTGVSYLERFQTTEDLLQAHGYMDSSQRAGLHLLTGDSEAALSVLGADTRPWPGSSYNARRARLLEAMKR